MYIVFHQNYKTRKVLLAVSVLHLRKQTIRVFISPPCFSCQAISMACENSVLLKKKKMYNVFVRENIF